jgi:DNA repair protein RecN (Recombination protein N)
LLSLLHIENIAVIEKAEIAFGPGLNVLTGETGAGKSIIIDSLNLLSGERASRDLIRTGEKRAIAEGVFTSVPKELIDFLEEQGIAPEEDGSVYITRQVGQDGRSLCRINGRPVPLSTLRVIGGLLLRCHGQQDSRSLTDADKHLALLDAYAENESLLQEYHTCLNKLKEIRHRQRALQMDEGEKARRIEMLTYQINEIEAAAITPGEDEALMSQRQFAENAEAVGDACQQVAFCLSGGIEPGSEGAISLLQTAARALINLGTAGQEVFGPLADRLAELSYLAEDCAADVAHAAGTLDELPYTLDEIIERLSVLNSLKKKYGGDLESVLEFLENAKAELEQITLSEDELIRLEHAYKDAYDETLASAQALSEQRKKAAREMEKAVNAELAYLSMAGAKFSVVFEPRRREGRLIFGADGLDMVSFYIAANKGEEAKPLAKTASGGELSRIMLALQTVLANKEGPTLIFDEIDAGISGNAAARVAERLARLSFGSQVLCVTHLPQMAAMADIHFHIAKGEKDGRTSTVVKKLTEEERMYELARIAGGDRPGESMLSAAKELLTTAKQYKQQNR